jgi:hypothetical protein
MGPVIRQALSFRAKIYDNPTMPLQDHFRPPLSVRCPWTGFHSTWANTICDELNDSLLPPRFHAIPNVQLSGTSVEIDVATLREDGWQVPTNGPGSWVPPAAGGTATIDFTGLDLFEVQVIYESGGPQLVAAIELLSPANKDRPANRRLFATKCASYLEDGASALIVDIVTERHGSSHADLLDLLDVRTSPAWNSPTGLSAVAYRARRENAHTNIDWWTEVLTLGECLPKMPLWIGIDVQVPIDLEATYKRTFERLRMPFPSAERNGK